MVFGMMSLFAFEKTLWLGNESPALFRTLYEHKEFS
jgi:hypothetical protein